MRKKCQFEDCKEDAVGMACGRKYYPKKPNNYCKEHQNIVADDHHPEYQVSCPHCGCRFGVN